MRQSPRVTTITKTSIATKISIFVIIGAAVASLGLAVLGMIVSLTRGS